ncbi:MAG: hypothetical protein KA144_11910 [Xanthomonadaceae bacterium]|nr:hypothetical protein [Xanthomonadaceae bacterium]
MRSLSGGKGLSLLLMLAGLALWMLLAGPGRLFGISTGQLGIVVLLAGTWALLYAVSRIPRDALDVAASPAEWKARIGTVFCLVAVVYFLANAHVFNDAPMRQNPEAAVVGRHLVLLLVAWAILSSMVASRWKGAVETDERDRDIAIAAAGWGHSALIFCIVGFAVTLGFTPAEKLEWATPPMIGNLLIFALMWGWLCEYVATLVLYRRDRAQTA